MPIDACPWGGFQGATASFCETRLCGWIVEPANTWSNISYFIAALFVFLGNRQEKRPELTLIAVTAFLVGLGSTIFHASGTRFGEVTDVSAMYLISGLFIVFAARRILPIGKAQLLILYFLVAGLSSLTLVLTSTNGIMLFAGHLAVATILEAIYFKRAPVMPDYKFLRFMVFGFGFAYLAWLLDFHKIVCDPDNHILGGHAVWHLSNATCLWTYFKYVQQFSKF
jgi:hypothetical protein